MSEKSKSKISSVQQLYEMLRLEASGVSFRSNMMSSQYTIALLRDTTTSRQTVPITKGEGCGRLHRGYSSLLNTDTHIKVLPRSVPKCFGAFVFYGRQDKPVAFSSPIFK